MTSGIVLVFVLVLAPALLLSLGNPYATRATTVLDQEYTASNGISTGFSVAGDTFRRAQTFTVGVAGILSEIDIFLPPFASTFSSFTGMNILSTVNSVPTTTVVSSGSFQSTSAGVADFTTSLPVIVREVLAIEPIAQDTSGFWRANLPGTYPGGQDFTMNPGAGVNSFTPTGIADNFRTFVTTTEPVVPLPAALPLFVTGLGALGLLGWRRKRKARAAVA